MGSRGKERQGRRPRLHSFFENVRIKKAENGRPFFGLTGFDEELAGRNIEGTDMQSSSVKPGMEPVAGLVPLGSVLFYPFRFLLYVAPVAVWIGTPLVGPWVLAHWAHCPVRWTYAVWGVGAATAMVVASTIRAHRGEASATFDDWVADVFVAGHWPLVVTFGPVLFLVTAVAKRGQRLAPPISARSGAAVSSPTTSAPIPDAGDTVRSARSAPPFRAAAPLP